jgi:hypothetical protein
MDKSRQLSAMLPKQKQQPIWWSLQSRISNLPRADSLD